MDFGLAVTSTPGMGKSDLIIKLSDDTEDYFKNKDYGQDIKAFTIGVHCENIPVGFEKFLKLPSPKYTKGKKTINPDGIPFTLEDNFEYSIRLDFETFKNASEREAEKILAKEILSSLDTLDSIKKKIKDFDWEAFKRDLKNYFIEKKLL